MYCDQVECLRWLGLNEATENVRLIQNDKGFGIEAAKDLKKGVVIATISNSNIITYQKALHSKLGQAISSTNGVTKEMLMWYYMCEEALNNGHFSAYLKSLKSSNSCLLTWEEDRLADLVGTNLLQHVMTTREQLISKYQILTNAYNNPKITMELFLWVYNIYVSRRYPHHLCKDESLGNVDTKQIQEENMSNMGIMVPFLDLINHNGEKEWLLLTPTPENLLIIINVEVKRGDEIYSNYGQILSNEKLLYTYGFAIPNNVHDYISVKLFNSNREIVGTFEIQRGGIAGCSTDLWKSLHKLYGDDSETTVEGEGPIIHVETCEILLEYIVNKYEQLLNQNPVAVECRSNSSKSKSKKKQKLEADSRRAYIKYFMEGQLEIMEDLLTDLNNIVDESE